MSNSSNSKRGAKSSSSEDGCCGGDSSVESVVDLATSDANATSGNCQTDDNGDTIGTTSVELVSLLKRSSNKKVAVNKCGQSAASKSSFHRASQQHQQSRARCSGERKSKLTASSSVGEHFQLLHDEKESTAAREITSNYQKPAIACFEEKSSTSATANQSSNDSEKIKNHKSTVGAAATSRQQPGANKKAQKPRRRVATLAQRRAANIRERRRMFNLNAAFDRLRKKVPSFAYEKRLSRIETLKLAIMYIRFMDDLVNDDAYAEKYKQLTANTSSSRASSGFLSSGSYLSLYGHCAAESPSPPPPLPAQVLALPQHLQLQQPVVGPVANQAQNFSRQQTGGTTNMIVQHSNSLINKQQQAQLVRPGQTLLERIGHNGSSVNIGCTINSETPIADYMSSCPAQVLAGFCNESRCQQMNATATQQQPVGNQQKQYRAKALQLSPLSSASLACCSSPTSSSVATCHSSQSLNESPNSSPIIQALPITLHQENLQTSIATKTSANSGVAATTGANQQRNHYYSQYSQGYEQQRQQQQRSISSPYYGDGNAANGTCQQANNKMLYYNELTPSSGVQPSEELLPLCSVANANTPLYSAGQQSGNHSNPGVVNENRHQHSQHQYHQQQHQDQSQQQQQLQSHHQVTSHYSLHSLEAR